MRSGIVMGDNRIYTTPGKFINPTTDPGFKILFGRESSKDILISLLNAILEGDGIDPIVSLEFLDKEKICQQEEERSVAFDLHCETSDKRRFIVEMQNLHHDWFAERVLQYAARAITEQSRPRKWNYEYMPVISVAFINFSLSNFKGQQMIDASPIDKFSNKLLTDRLRLIIIQLPEFKESDPDKCLSQLQQWIYTIKNMENMERIPFADRNPIFRRVAEVASMENLSKEDRRRYESDLKMYHDYCSAVSSGHRRGLEEGLTKGMEEGMKEGMAKGIKEGMKEGMAKGIKEGIAKGRAEGIAEGIREQTIRTAKILKGKGTDINTIIEITGLTPEFIVTL